MANNNYIIPRESREEDYKALNYLSTNALTPESQKLKNVMGLNDEDIKAYQYMQSNPNNPQSQKVKEIIYKKIADKLPESQEQGISFKDRTILKNLLYREPQDQEKYLKSKGYDVKRKGGRLLVRSPESTRYSVIDPRGFDWQDITDIGGQILGGIGTGVGSGAKVLGAIGSPVTGGLSALAGSGLAGAITGGLEGARQLGGKLVGAREKFEPKKIGQEALLGATIPLAFRGVAGGARKLLSPFIGKAGRAVGAKTVEKVGKRLNIPVTPAQTRASTQVAGLESYLQKTPFVGGGKTKATYNTIARRLRDLGEEIGEKRATESGYQLGGKIRNFVLKDFDEKIKPVEKIYKGIEQKLKDTQVVKDKLYATISELADDARFDATGGSQSLLKKIKGIVDKVESVSDLKKFRSSLGKMLDKSASDSKLNIVKRMYNPITEARNDSLIRGAGKLPPQQRYLTVSQIKEADKAYKNIMKNTMDIKKIVETTPDDRIIDKLFNVKNVKQINSLKQEFPSAYELARTKKLADILQKSETDGSLSMRKLVRNFDKLEEEGKLLIFGDDATKKIGDLKTYINTLPKDVNPSGTGTYRELGGIVNVFGQLGSLGSGVVYDIVTGTGILGKIANFIRTLAPATIKGGTYTLGDIIKEK